MLTKPCPTRGCCLSTPAETCGPNISSLNLPRLTRRPSLPRLQKVCRSVDSCIWQFNATTASCKCAWLETLSEKGRPRGNGTGCCTVMTLSSICERNTVTIDKIRERGRALFRRPIGPDSRKKGYEDIVSRSKQWDVDVQKAKENKTKQRIRNGILSSITPFYLAGNAKKNDGRHVQYISLPSTYQSVSKRGRRERATGTSSCCLGHRW